MTKARKDDQIFYPTEETKALLQQEYLQRGAPRGGKTAIINEALVAYLKPKEATPHHES